MQLSRSVEEHEGPEAQVLLPRHWKKVKRRLLESFWVIVMSELCRYQIVDTWRNINVQRTYIYLRCKIFVVFVCMSWQLTWTHLPYFNGGFSMALSLDMSKSKNISSELFQLATFEVGNPFMRGRAKRLLEGYPRKTGEQDSNQKEYVIRMTQCNFKHFCCLKQWNLPNMCHVSRGWDYRLSSIGVSNAWTHRHLWQYACLIQRLGALILDMGAHWLG